MKISNSNISMASTHQESSFAYKESLTIQAAKSKDVSAAILSLSAEGAGKSLKEAMVDFKKQQEEEAEKRKQENDARSLQQMAEQMKTEKEGGSFEMSDEYEMKIKMLRQMLAALRGEKLPEELKAKSSISVGTVSVAKLNTGNLEIGTNASGTTWQRITATSGFFSESESTTFASKGVVQTADGRSIDFNIEMTMSRAFMTKIDTLEVKDYKKTDPLIINLDSNIASVSDQKFFFDLDSDGKEEKISFAGKGSGFLALDMNGDGKINDGSELFGTKSGDGFKDLAAYDEDGNGWIDENDSIFSRLKVWTKDENGNDYLIDLKKADVGAIYLRSVDTQFSLKDDKNDLNAEIKKTGVYLKESTGMVGTLNHVDLVV